LEARQIEVKETVSASKKLQRKDAKDIAQAAKKVIVSKGKKVTEFQGGPKVGKDLLDVMLGSTGNLRAPLIKAGKTVLVGFNADVYEDVLG
jgi:arsenate reductase-like glutaredoxin family protein